MRYLTTTVDFYYDGLDWRIQLWKGQYGPFGGGEVGVYTKDPETNDKLYNCADNDHLLNMYYDLYLTPNTYAVKNRFSIAMRGRAAAIGGSPALRWAP